MMRFLFSVLIPVRVVGKKVLLTKGLFSFVLLLWGHCLTHAQEITLSSAQRLPFNITPSIEIFRDSTAKMTLAQATTQTYRKSTKDHFVFPYTNDVFWVRFILKNTDVQTKKWFLVWGNPLVEQLDFYISDSTDQRFQHTQQKMLTYQKDKKMIDQEPKFGFELGPQQTKKIYVKLTSKRGHYGTLKIHSEASYYTFRMEDYSGQGFFNGLVIFRLFLVITLSLFVIKDLPFRLYSLHTVIKTFAFWGYLNIAGPWFTDDPDLAKKIDFLFYNSVTIGAGIFVYFTQIRGRLPKVHSIFALTVILVTIFESVIIFVDYQWYWLKMGVYSIIISAVYFSGLYVYCIARKITIEKYYAIPFILGLLSYALLYIRLLGWIEYEPLYSIAYLLFLGEIFVFVIFLGRIFRNTEQNKRLAEQQLSFNLEQSARLKELDALKTTFFANISHEFRTPLTLILSPLRDLQKEFPGRDIFRTMQQNAERLLALINQLLDLSKLEAGKMTVEIRQANLSQFLRQLFSSFESLAQSKHIVFQHEQSHSARIAYFDGDKIEKIVTNLLSNAFKFTPENGRIIVRAEYDEHRFTLRVQDFGIGIDAHRLPRIFDRFYQVDDGNRRDYEGTGIGLALVKELVEILQGQIDVQSKVGQGTTFTVTIPCDKATWYRHLVADGEEREVKPKPSEAALSIQKEEQSEPPKTDLPMLLVVEDNDDLRAYVSGIFAGNYQIHEARDGQEGLEKALELVPDVVICDLMMPRLDGFGFCKALKTDMRTNHIPVVMLTAKATLEDRIEGLELGADEYLSKPFNTEELQVRVRNLVQQRRALRQKYGPSVLLNIPDPVEAVRKAAGIDEQFLHKAGSVLERCLADSQFDVESFAAEMGMTSVQLRRKIKALTDRTVTEHIRNYRLEKAAGLLQQKAGTVSEIAYRVGFESLSYFSKVFMEKYGLSPSEYVGQFP